MHPYPNSMLIINSYVTPALRILAPTPGGLESATITATGYTDIPALASGDRAQYLDKPMTAGKWYWELLYQTAEIVAGITNDITTPNLSFGGFANSRGSWVYRASSSQLSRNWGANEEVLSPAPSAGDRICMMFDADTKTMTYRTNGAAVSVSHDVSARAAPFYAAFAWSIASANNNEIRLGPVGCLYAPPTGYNYL